jgi:molybdenum cofactor biosynthesis protein B
MTADAARLILVTVSDTRDASNDRSGARVRELVTAAGAIVQRHVIVRDEPADLAALLTGIAQTDEADAVILTGGTGIAPRDTTPEALAGLYTKTLDGFGEAFRRLSWDEVGFRAVFSRASAGLVGQLVVFSLPGSPKGAALGTRELVIPMLRHAIDLARGSASASHAPLAPQAVAPAPQASMDKSPNVHVLYFAALRDYAQVEEEDVALPAEARTVAAFLAHAETLHPALAGRLSSIRVACNERIVGLDHPVVGGDVLALLPPFAGG